MKTKYWLLLVSCFTLLINCSREKNYSYEAIEAEVAPYLQQDLYNTFAVSDTMIIYDTTFFNTAIATLKQYKNNLKPQDSLYNNQIINRLEEIETQAIQTKYPDLYLSFDKLIDNFTKNDIDKVMTWLTACPQQFKAAKVQLNQVDIPRTETSIETLKTAYAFVSNDLKTQLIKQNQYEKYKAVIINNQLAIKDYLAFLNSKLLNGETL